MLSREDARAFYDAFGARQDEQGHYEDPPLRALIARSELASATAVFEFGCGTGRFAEQLLAAHLPPGATYLGCDISSTMVALARQRLAPYADRAEVCLSDGEPRAPCSSGSVDRFLSTYVLDLLSPGDITAIVGEALRVLRPGGLFGVTGLTPGNTALSRLTSSLWHLVHRLSPRTVGGCRPLRLLDCIDSGAWQLRHREVLVAARIPSEVVVLRKPAEAPPAAQGHRGRHRRRG